MTRAVLLDLTAEHRRIVCDIIGANLPQGTVAWVFGSRAIGRARRHSDLDLAIDAGRRLTLDEFATLVEAFSDSDLPYKVDVVNWRAIAEGFRRLIAEQRVAFTAAAAAIDSTPGGGPGRSAT